MKRITVLMFLVLFLCSVTVAFAVEQRGTSSMAGEQKGVAGEQKGKSGTTIKNKTKEGKASKGSEKSMDIIGPLKNKDK